MIRPLLLTTALAFLIPSAAVAAPAAYLDFEEEPLSKREICERSLIFLDGSLSAEAVSCLCDYIVQGIPGDIASQYCSHLLPVEDTTVPEPPRIRSHQHDLLAE